jgi:putative ABC transport system permease protein
MLTFIMVIIGAVATSVPQSIGSLQLAELRQRAQGTQVAGWHIVRVSRLDDRLIPPSIVDTLATAGGVRWVIGLEPSVDARVPLTDLAIPLRGAYGRHLDSVGLPDVVAHSPNRLAVARLPLPLAPELSSTTSARIGDADGFELISWPGVQWSALGVIGGEGLLFGSRADGFTSLLVGLDSLSAAQAAATTVPAIVDKEGLQQLSVTPSADALEAEGAFQNGLERGARVRLSALVLALAGLASVVQLLAVRLRLREFARRRALGASRVALWLIVELEVLVSSAVGAAVGAIVSRVWLQVVGLPWSTENVVALCALTASIATVVIAPVATWAARADPVTILRVP